MSYYLSKTVNMPFDAAKDAVTTKLKEVGFGILTEIDMKKTLKEKINEDIKPYVILGACNPHFANDALKVENQIGTLLPCNVTVRDNEDGTCEICIIDPTSMAQTTGNDSMMPFAEEVKSVLKGALDALPVS